MSAKQVRAAKRNVQKAQRAATKKRTIANLPKSTRSELGKQAARGRRRGGEAWHALEDRNRQQSVRAREGEGHQGPLENGEVGSHPGAETRRLSRPNGASGGAAE